MLFCFPVGVCFKQVLKQFSATKTLFNKQISNTILKFYVGIVNLKNLCKNVIETLSSLVINFCKSEKIRTKEIDLEKRKRFDCISSFIFRENEILLCLKESYQCNTNKLYEIDKSE